MTKLTIGVMLWLILSTHLLISSTNDCNLALSNSYLGREFWVAVIFLNAGIIDNFTTVTVVAPYGAYVQLSVPSMGFQTPQVYIPPMQSKVFSYRTGDFIDISQTQNDLGTINTKVAHIQASQPVMVIVERYEDDDQDYYRYVAYPVESWGREYLHVSGPDLINHRHAPNIGMNAAGMLILSNYEGTNVTVELHGRGRGWIRFNGRDELIQFPEDNGKTYNITLKRGEVLNFANLGQSEGGSLDISGTKVSANKPIGVVSYHTSPLDLCHEDYGTEDNYVEMIAPVDAWGTRYITRGLDDQKGDNYLVMAKEANTIFTVRWYDSFSGQFRGEWSGLLQKPGDYLLYSCGYGSDDFITGYAVWESNKPCMVIQLGRFRAEMDTKVFLPGIPLEQYLCEHYLHLYHIIFERLDAGYLLYVRTSGDTTFKEIYQNNAKLWYDNPSIGMQQVPGTEYLAIKMRGMTEGIYHIWTESGSVPLGVTVYGVRGNLNTTGTNYSYTLSAWNRLGKVDTEAPRLEKEVSCGNARIVARDDSIAAPYEDLGISRVELLTDRSYNYRLVLEQPAVLENRGEGYWRQVIFRLELEDPWQDGKAVYGVVDWAGNVRVDSVLYQAPKLAIEDTLVDMDTVRVGRWKEATIRVINRGDTVVQIDSVWLSRGKEYRIEQVEPPLPVALGSGDTLLLVVRYTPQQERQNEQWWDRDTVQMGTSCWQEPISRLRGQGVQPHIAVGDWDARTVDVGKRRCNGEPLYDFAQTVRVRNEGTAALVIRGIEGIVAPFELDSQQVSFPIRVEPGEQVYVKGACFAPQAVGSYEIAVVFQSDGIGDSISVWRGRAIGSAPYAEGYEWDWVRVGQQQEGIGRVINGGEAAIRVDTVWIDGQDAEQFGIVGYRYRGMDVERVRGMSLAGGDTLEVVLAYAPQQESAEHVGQMVAGFSDGQQVAGQLRGKAYVPRIGAAGYRFACVEIGDTSEERGEVRIWNAAEVGRVRVEAVELEAGAFWWEEPVAMPVELGVGDTLRLVVRYAARQQWDSSAVVIRSDAGISGKQEDTVWVIGCGIAPQRVQVQVDGYDYGVVVGCGEEYGEIRIWNQGQQWVEVVGMRMEGADAGGFRIEDRQYPIRIGAGEEERVGIWYVGKEAREYAAVVVVRLRTEAGKEWEEEAAVRGQRQAEQERWSIVLDGEQVQPGQQVEGRLVYEGSGQLDWVRVQIRWNGQGMRVEGYEQVAAGWQWEEVGRGNGWIELQGRGQQRLAEGGVLQLVYGIYLQADSVQLSSWVAEVEREGECVQVERGGDQVQVREYCLREARGIAIGSGYGIAVEQEGERLVVRYGVGLQGRVQIEIYGQMGEKVAVVVDRQEEAGWKQVEVEMAGMASGMYYVRYRSGRYEQVVPLWWVR